MRILLHICCANCVIFPFLQLKGKGEEVTGYFFNPNIHPYQEYQKRLEALKVYSGKSSLEVTYRNEYLLEAFLMNVALHPEERCRYCYSVRLEATAREAKRSRFDSFSTTLLYSIYQKHDLIKEMGERIAEEVGISFHYEDFRRGWREGVKASRAMGLYQQQYCGCIYSEKERFADSKKMSKDKAQRRNEIPTKEI
jgi:predicted adenine nucleotide alpha hydrolase (AANH) superfamily ATPase